MEIFCPQSQFLTALSVETTVLRFMLIRDFWQLVVEYFTTTFHFLPYTVFTKELFHVRHKQGADLEFSRGAYFNRKFCRLS